MQKTVLFFVLFWVAGAARAESVNKQDWMAYMNSGLAGQMCAEEGFFRQCYEVSEAVCMSTFSTTINQCLDFYSVNIPATLQQPRDGEYWGTRVGECAGMAFDKKHPRHNTFKCSKLEFWLD